MRFRIVALLCLVWAFLSPDVMDAQSYQKILIKRDGGGNKVFSVALETPARLLRFEVTKYDFKPVNFAFSRSLDSLGTVALLVEDIISGAASIKGESLERPAPTGTWLHIYAVTVGGSKDEITSRTIRDQLLDLETCVEEYVRNAPHLH